MRLFQVGFFILLLSSLSAAQQYAQYQQPYNNQPYNPYAYTQSPYYDWSSAWQKGWNGPYYMPGLRYTPDGTEAAIYPPLYGSARYNPYADDRNFEIYQQTRDMNREYLKANEAYDDLNYPAKQLGYLRFFASTDPRYYWATPVMYPYGKKPYFKKYGSNPAPQGTLTEGINPFYGFVYSRGLSCHGPNYGCSVHNVFPEST